MINFFGFITSRGLAVFLLIISSAFLVFWEIYPGLFSPVFLTIPALLFLSLLLCTAKRFVESQKRGSIFWGSIIFHAGMIVVVAAASFGVITRFSASINLLKDVTVNLEGKGSASLRKEPFDDGKAHFLFMKLEDYKAAYVDEKFPVKYTASVEIGIIEGNVYRNIKEDIEVNRPFHYSGYTFLFQSGEYSPRFILKDKDRKIVFDRYLRLSNSTKNEDSFDIPKANLKLYTRFFPDVFRERGKVGSRSPVLNNPAFGIKIVAKDNPFQEIWKGLLKKGDKAAFKDFTLEFADLKPYVAIEAVKDASYWGILTGWILIVAGLGIRYSIVLIKSGGKMKSMETNQWTTR